MKKQWGYFSLSVVVAIGATFAASSTIAQTVDTARIESGGGGQFLELSLGSLRGDGRLIVINTVNKFPESGGIGAPGAVVIPGRGGESVSPRMYVLPRASTATARPSLKSPPKRVE